MYTYLFPCILLISTGAYYWGTLRANTVADRSGGIRSLHSLPSHYGMLTALSSAIPALFVFILWRIFEETIITFMVVKSLPVDIQQLSTNLTTVTVQIVTLLVGDQEFDSPKTLAALALGLLLFLFTLFPEVKTRRIKKQLYSLISPAAAYKLQDMLPSCSCKSFTIHYGQPHTLC